MLQDAVYYCRREAAERGLAEQSADARVRDVHLQLADKYAELARRAMAAMPGGPGDAPETLSSQSPPRLRGASPAVG